MCVDSSSTACGWSSRPVAAAATAAGIAVRTALRGWPGTAGGRGGVGRSSVDPASSATPNRGRGDQRDPDGPAAAAHHLGHCGAPAGARSTVAAILARHGVNPLASLELAAPGTRYERARPGELVHLDIKPLGRILRVGHRFDGSRRSHRVGAGWEYVHVAIDDYSRAAYVEVLADQTGATRRPSCGAPFAGSRAAGSSCTALTDNGARISAGTFTSAPRAPGGD